MPINFPYGFTITSIEPIDSRFLMTREQMKDADVRMPDRYLTICADGPDAGRIFIYDSAREVDEVYGRFRVLSYDDIGGTPEIPTRLAQLTDDAGHRLVTDEQIDSWTGKQDAIPEGTYVRPSDLAAVATTGSYNDLTDRPEIPEIPDISKGADIGEGNVMTDIQVSGHAISVVRGSKAVLEGDPRLTDARTPLAHVHVPQDIAVDDEHQFATAQEKARWNEGQANVIEGIRLNGTPLAPDASKTVDIEVIVPTSLSELDNDTGFVTRDVADLANYYNKSSIDDMLSGSMKYKTASPKADGTPNVENPEERTIYLVPSKSSKSKNTKDEYLWVDREWELIGSTTMKLAIVQDSDGIKINDDRLQDATTAQNGLMTKEMAGKLEGIEENAQRNVRSDWNATEGDAVILNKPEIPTELADLADDPAHRTVTDEQIEAWSAVQPGVQSDWGEMDSSAASYIRNKPVIPSELAELGDDETHRLVTDAEKAKWDNAGENIIEKVAVDGTELPITDKMVDIPLTRTVQTMLAQYDPKVQSIAVWEAGKTYMDNSTVLRESELFVSLADYNTADPLEDDTHWKKLSGSGGGSGSVEAFTYQFGNDTDTVYMIPHKLGTYDFLHSIRTTDASRRYVYADIYAETLNRAKVVLTSPPGPNALQINMVKAASSSGPTDNVQIITIAEPARVWNVQNTTAYPTYIQTFTWDEEGGYYDEVMSDVIQPPESDFTPVEISFSEDTAGFIVMAPSEIQQEFTDSDTWVINHGTNTYYAVQVYTVEEGMRIADVVQANGTITVSFTTPESGWVVLMKPSMTVHLDNETAKRITHNIGRYVGMQVYNEMEGQTFMDFHNVDENTCEVDFNGTFSGYLLII